MASRQEFHVFVLLQNLNVPVVDKVLKDFVLCSRTSLFALSNLRKHFRQKNFAELVFIKIGHVFRKKNLLISPSLKNKSQTLYTQLVRWKW